jgi:V/A-type H+-transporting ATPase subunit B
MSRALARDTGGLESRGLDALRGPLAFVRGVPGVALHELCELVDEAGPARLGRVLSVAGEAAVVEVLGSTDGLTLERCRVRFAGHPLRQGVGRELLGRVFDGVGRPRDGLPPPLTDEERAIGGSAMSPVRREYPRDFLETGVSAIDGLASVVLGQKIPIFSEAGLPHHELARQILRQAHAPGVGVGEFAVVFAALGLPRDVAAAYAAELGRGGALARTVAFLNHADDPAPERLITPRCALTAAEYLAFDLGLHVLVVLADMTAYGEALREVAAARGEVPSRRGYPGYLYSDLASIFERAGRIRGRPGSLTQIPIVTMPSGDMTHPIPDLTGYVTEGQIVLQREIHRRGVYPPINVLPSLSRLMDDGIGAGRTRDDHAAVAKQLYAACARVERARSLESIVGREDLAPIEQRYLAFGAAFERELLAQGPEEARSIEATLELGWKVLGELPDEELARIPAALLARRRAGGAGGGAR